MKKCENCQNLIPESSQECQYCIARENPEPPPAPKPVSPESKQQTTVLIMLAAVALMLFIFIASLYQSPSTSSSQSSDSTPPQRSASKEWYEGGNLHKKTHVEWRSANYSNRLATAGDFISGNYNDGSLLVPVKGMEDIKRYSIELEACMSAYINGLPKGTEHHTVVEASVLCMVQLGYLKLN